MKEKINQYRKSVERFLTENFCDRDMNPDFDFDCFHHYLPYRIYDHLDKLYYNTQGLGFILELMPLVGAIKEMVDILSGLFTEGISPGISIQVYNYASPSVGHMFSKYVQSKEGEFYQNLANRRSEYFKEANWKSITHNPYLVRDFKVYIAVSTSEHDNRYMEILDALRKQLKSTLLNMGIESKEVDASEFLNFVDEIISPSSKSSEHRKSWDHLQLLNEQLLNPARNIEVQPGQIVITNGDEKFEVRSYIARDLPDYWAQWNNQDLIGDLYSDYSRIGCPFIKVLTLCYEEGANDKDFAQFRLVRASQANNSILSKFVPALAEKERDWRFVVDKLNRGQKLIKGFYQVLLISKSGEIEENESNLLALYKTKGWGIKSEKYLQLHAFLSVLPFNVSCGIKNDLVKFGRLRSMVTWTAANLAPLIGEYKGTDKPTMMLFGRRGQPMFWDPFSNPSGNYNVAVVGKSGSGKSVFMQELVSSLRGAGGKVIVVDDGRSFMNSCILQGGTFIEFSNENPICINPFSIINENEFRQSIDYRGEVIQLLNMIVRQMCRNEVKTDDFENSIIADTINHVISEKGCDASMNDIQQQFSCSNEIEGRRLGEMIKPYCSGGTYSRYFEGRSNLSLESELFVFEFERIKSKPEFQRIVLMVLIFLVTEKMFHGDRKQTTSLVIDEAWSLLHGNSFADFIEGIARRARKYNGNIITGTQSIDDYYKNPAALAAIQNTDWICLLSQKKESIQAMKESDRIKLDQNMEKMLTSLKMVSNQYSEVMIYGSGLGWSVGRLILDPFSVALFSSKGSDVAKVRALQEEGYKLEDALELIAMNLKK